VSAAYLPWADDAALPWADDAAERAFADAS
jgi:hypothetical protein